MADRIGVINKGEIILVEKKVELMRKLGKKQLTLELQQPLDSQFGGALAVRQCGARRRRQRSWASATITAAERIGMARAFERPRRLNIRFRDLAHHAEFARGHLRRPCDNRATAP